MIMQQEIHENFRITKIQTISLVLIYQDKQLKVFFNKLISQKNYTNMMVQQCFFIAEKSAKSSRTSL